MSEHFHDIVVLCNFAPVTRENYRIGVPDATSYDEIFNTDDIRFGGSGVVNKGTPVCSDRTGSAP